jgi:hypothetical protein
MVYDASLGFVTAVDERGFVALESFCLSRARSNQVLTRHHKSAQISAAFRYASVAAMGSPGASGFLRELSAIVTRCGTLRPWLVQQGVDLYAVGQILGHKTPRMTQRYAHLSPDYMAGAMGKLDGMMCGMLNDEETIEEKLIPICYAMSPNLLRPRDYLVLNSLPGLESFPEAIRVEKKKKPKPPKPPTP